MVSDHSCGTAGKRGHGAVEKAVSGPESCPRKPFSTPRTLRERFATTGQAVFAKATPPKASSAIPTCRDFVPRSVPIWMGRGPQQLNKTAWAEAHPTPSPRPSPGGRGSEQRSWRQVFNRAGRWRRSHFFLTMSRVVLRSRSISSSVPTVIRTNLCTQDSSSQRTRMSFSQSF